MASSLKSRTSTEPEHSKRGPDASAGGREDERKDGLEDELEDSKSSQQDLTASPSVAGSSGAAHAPASSHPPASGHPPAAALHTTAEPGVLSERLISEPERLLDLPTVLDEFVKAGFVSQRQAEDVLIAPRTKKELLQHAMEIVAARGAIRAWL